MSVLAEALRAVMVSEDVFPGSSRMVSEKLAEAIARQPKLTQYTAIVDAAMAWRERSRNSGDELPWYEEARLAEAIDLLTSESADKLEAREP